MSGSGEAGRVRRATRADAGALARTLARAFVDDPVAIWSCRPDALRRGVLERFHALRLRDFLGGYAVWTNEELSSTAIWSPPDRWRSGPLAELAYGRCLAHPRLVARLPLVAYGLDRIERRHPVTPPHWYLAVLGTDPPAQGRGLGSAALRPVLERADADGVGAYLESSKESNVPFYERHGFRVTQELRLPRGPVMWAMWRNPRTRPAAAPGRR